MGASFYSPFSAQRQFGHVKENTGDRPDVGHGFLSPARRKASNLTLLRSPFPFSSTAARRRSHPSGRPVSHQMPLYSKTVHNAVRSSSVSLIETSTAHQVTPRENLHSQRCPVPSRPDCRTATPKRVIRQKHRVSLTVPDRCGTATDSSTNNQDKPQRCSIALPQSQYKRESHRAARHDHCGARGAAQKQTSLARAVPSGIPDTQRLSQRLGTEQHARAQSGRHTRHPSRNAPL